MENSSEAQGIREAIAHYIDGMRTHDVETLKRGFHDLAILCGYLGDDLVAAPIVALYEWVAATPAPSVSGEPFGCEILKIDVTRRVAAVTVRETGHETVIDHFHLLKVDERWWIVSKLWDAEA